MTAQTLEGAELLETLGRNRGDGPKTLPGTVLTLVGPAAAGAGAAALL